MDAQGAAQAPRQAATPHPMARINYAIRAGAFAYSLLVVGVHGWERGLGVAFWAFAAVVFLVYPHLAWLHAREAADPKRAEETNLYVDAVLLGAVVASLHFPLWPSYGALFSAAMNATVVAGWIGALYSVAAFAGGAACGLAAAALIAGAPFVAPVETSAAVTALSIGGSLVYSCAIGSVVFSLRERLRAGREALRGSEARYRLLAENAADLVGMVDRDGRWIYASPSYWNVLDGQDLLAGVDAFRRVHPDDADVARVAVLRAAATGRPRELSLRLVDREGRVRRFDTRVQPVNGTRPADHLLLVSRDVTEVRESEERLLVAAHALEGMSEALMITSVDGTIVTANDALCRLRGLPRDKVLGRSERELRSPLEPASFYDEVFASVARNGYWSGTALSRRAPRDPLKTALNGGAVRREWVSVRAVRDGSGRATHYVWVFHEIGNGSSDAGSRPRAQ